MLAYSGFILVPLGHGTTIQPACAALSGLLLASLVLHEKPTIQRIIGGAIIVVGLLMFGAESLATIGRSGVAGDLLFATAGLFWATFGTLLRLWNVPGTRAVKAVGAVVGGLIFFLLFVVVGVMALPIPINFLMALIGVAFGYTIPEFWLGGRVKKRQHAILLQIPDALDLLTISVRAGLGFDAALGKVVEKLQGPLTEEFRRALAEVRVGKARRDALRDIVARTEVTPLTNFIGAIIQAEQLGVSISKVLQVQSEQLRIERRQRAEEAAAKAPIKMLFPLVGCIFPSLFIVILGPAIILIVQNLKVGG